MCKCNTKKIRDFSIIFFIKHFEVCPKTCNFAAKVGMKMCKPTIKVIYSKSGGGCDYYAKYLRKCHVTSALKMDDYNIGRSGQLLTMPMYMAFLLTDV